MFPDLSTRETRFKFKVGSACLRRLAAHGLQLCDVALTGLFQECAEIFYLLQAFLRGQACSTATFGIHLRPTGKQHHVALKRSHYLLQ